MAGDYLLPNEVGHEAYYPLRLYVCQSCFLVQILDVVQANKLFSDYRYLSSVGLTSHFKMYADEMVGKYIKKGDFVVEIGSNDGVLLGPLQNLGINVLGVDPAKNVVEIANRKGLLTLQAYFDLKIAALIQNKYGLADAIFANNVLAHIDDISNVFKGISSLLKPQGVLVFEVHYLPDLLNDLQYDFFYNEHLNYYSFNSLKNHLSNLGLNIFHAKRIPTHGGSMRYYAQKMTNTKKQTQSLKRLLRDEMRYKLNDKQTYDTFAEKALVHRDQLMKTLKNYKAVGKRIVGYGASGRANTLLNFCGIDQNILEYIVDASPERFGRFTPGMHIPVVPPSYFRNNYPDLVLLLAWNYQDMIMKNEKDFLKKKGKFIIPLPTLRII